MSMKHFIFAAIAVASIQAHAAAAIPKDATLLKCETSVGVGQSVTVTVGNGHEKVLALSDAGRVVISGELGSQCEVDGFDRCALLDVDNIEKTVSTGFVSLPFIDLNEGRGWKITLREAGGIWSGELEDIGSPGELTKTTPVTCAFLTPELLP